MAQPLPAVQSMQSLYAAYAEDDEANEKEDVVSEIKIEEAVKSNLQPETVIDRSEPVEMNISGSEDESTVEEVPKIKKMSPEVNSSPLPKKSKSERTATRLVSYGADEVDDVNDVEKEAEEEDEDGIKAEIVKLDDSYEQADFHASFARSLQNMATNDISLPPEPAGRCSVKLQEKIKNLYEKMKRDGTDLNASIQRRKDFRNPSIYEKLIDYCGIDEKGTNYPPEIYNTAIWGPESYYDELAKIQKAEMDKREKEKKERTKVEFVTATKKQTPDGTAVVEKRKSKWDSQAVSAAQATLTSSTSSSSLANNSVSSKTTFISATGGLKKTK